MVNIAVVGIGMMGQTHANAIVNSKEEIRLAAICGADIEADRNRAANYNCPFFTDINEVLKNDEIDVIDICTPTFSHEETIIKAANAGKNILCEKPFCLSKNVAGQLKSICEEKKVKLMVAQVIRFKPEYEMLKKAVDNGKLGNVRVGFFRRMTSGAGRIKRNVKWYDDPSKSGGAVFDLMIHDLDFVYSMLGRPKTVYATGRKSPSGCWDEVELSLTYENEAKIVIEASSFMPEKYPFTVAFRVNGELGCMEYSAGSAVNTGSNMEGSFFKFYPKNGDVKNMDIESSDDYQREIEYFCECVQKNISPDKVPVEQSVAVIEIVEKILESLETNSVIAL
jgi:UDP-N-acetylglucosamine 3-dehydrogenase